MKTPWSAPCRPIRLNIAGRSWRGLRILARVAIRSYMEEQAAASPRAETQEHGGGEEG